MKKSVKILATVFAFICTIIPELSFGQVKFGPKAGLNFSVVPNNTPYIVDQQIYSGYLVGGIAEIRLFNGIFLQPGVLISNKGSEYVVGNTSVNSATGYSNFQFSAFYADFPLSLEYKFDLGSYKLFLIAGPQFGYGLAGSWHTTNGTSSNVRFGNDPTDDFNPFDYGINFGGGFEAGRIQISTQYYFGLKTLSTLNPPLSEQKYKVLNISIAYLFGEEKKVRDYKSRYLAKYKHNKKHQK